MHIVYGIMMLKGCRAAGTDFIPTLQDNFVMPQTATDTTYFLQIHRLARLDIPTSNLCYILHRKDFLTNGIVEQNIEESASKRKQHFQHNSFDI